MNRPTAFCPSFLSLAIQSRLTEIFFIYLQQKNWSSTDFGGKYLWFQRTVTQIFQKLQKTLKIQFRSKLFLQPLCLFVAHSNFELWTMTQMARRKSAWTAKMQASERRMRERNNPTFERNNPTFDLVQQSNGSECQIKWASVLNRTRRACPSATREISWWEQIRTLDD